ncbi:MAG: hypothetical protein UV01_C0012G0033 [Parcubacteria group bacterium GW2011_GWA2_42_14]|nr:MAG: hypothetical protein UV01_C0012G0033 [Parcubacteria group bacterium GW2011_GWA2_42_14]OGY15735.1 MAG: hypothetical protein A3I52_01605 [Candidatus Blackburnbacteria bacterium RIFCSPLOWO2_02_FULL_40_10]OGZ97814.1 MAG: hypothetical protein A3D41_04770 [Candidatus Sungbacteria bacterium RIFCSPHIGHO2_02_FULL_41_12b]
MHGTGPGGEDKRNPLKILVFIAVIVLLILYILVFGGCSDGQSSGDAGSVNNTKSAELALNPNMDPGVKNGQKIFQTNCVACHGVRGKGDGGAAKALPKKPQDLTLSEIQNLPNSVLSQKIRNGAPSNGMPPWKHFNDKEISDLVAYIKTLK